MIDYNPTEIPQNKFAEAYVSTPRVSGSSGGWSGLRLWPTREPAPGAMVFHWVGNFLFRMVFLVIAAQGVR